MIKKTYLIILYYPFNQTILELKCYLVAVVEIEVARLLIKPYWNWNIEIVLSFSSVPVPLLIKPYWNWNAWNPCFWEGKVYSFNQTILELKSYLTRRSLQRLALLIKPYWNWNAKEVSPGISYLVSFNQTILELK